MINEIIYTSENVHFFLNLENFFVVVFVAAAAVSPLTLLLKCSTYFYKNAGLRASVGSASVIVCYYFAVFTSEVQAVRRSSPCFPSLSEYGVRFAFGLGSIINDCLNIFAFNWDLRKAAFSKRN
ncbi:hypothetical protein AVEN_87843-1 [Araneus ventricosus]|uniref:Uncharacterized protein n=1 Tax=Araneus ventricosus TaxID=182803 RepID=A0A4Y2BDQ2_ARAVE|nr:hypothetical protein AVEN_87843-1 [Araneus ventricosus]